MTGFTPAPSLRALMASTLSDLEAEPTGVLNADQEAPEWPGGPVFDEEGWARVPDEEFVLEALRVFYDVGASEDDPSPSGVVMVIAEWWTCDLCAGVARYETYLRDRSGARVAANACGRCVFARGLPWLGAGATTYLMSVDEVPPVLLSRVLGEDHAREEQGGRSRMRPWQLALSRRGCAGPDRHGRMGVSFADVSVLIKPWYRQPQPETIEIIADVRNGRRFGSNERIVPADLDEVLLWHHLTQTAAAELNYVHEKILQERTELPLETAVALMRNAVEEGAYEEYDSTSDWDDRGGFYFLGNGSRGSLNERAAEQVAASDLKEELVYLVQYHPSGEVRRRAVENAACPREARMYAARHDSALRGSLLTLDVDPEIMRELATAIALRPGPPFEAAAVAAHRYCPPDLVRGLVEQAARGNPEGRVTAAAAANGAEPDRRDEIQAQLLKMSRKGRILDELLATITRPNNAYDQGRIDWLRQHPDPKVRRYAAYLAMKPDNSTTAAAQADM